LDGEDRGEERKGKKKKEKGGVCVIANSFFSGRGRAEGAWRGKKKKEKAGSISLVRRCNRWNLMQNAVGKRKEKKRDILFRLMFPPSTEVCIRCQKVKSGGKKKNSCPH